MTKKHARQAAILDLVATHVVGSQEELRQLLLARGMDVTQATLSRDLRDLGLARVSTEDGGRYVRPESLADDEDKPLLGNLLPQLFSKIDGVGELIVLSTVRSGAQPIAEAIDQEEFEEVLGTIAGDDTILIVTRSAAARQTLTTRLLELAGES
ncbi:MAG: arginine repressor [Gemmatimonadaceae bacterium]|nr:arginine repressor [Gemmatimonadaceae bacterium]NUO95671.1 arginine repressor [Gemmatimonadaceae bacterium]NUP70423.1 arginine repressor [Gemmatimonadaceae bacterium]NUR34793.1 arginine repressor [Gemmatimonadaceae bacterium]NUS33655.1 arginine repressor [Gemmatimonadaceae bacterium]